MEKEYKNFHLDSEQSITDIESTEDKEINAKMVSDQYRVTPETEASSDITNRINDAESAVLSILQARFEPLSCRKWVRIHEKTGPTQ